MSQPFLWPIIAVRFTLEGINGVFYRIKADIRMNHPFSDANIALLAQLARTFEEQGTTLVFVPIPTKSVTMPEYLPDEAGLYGFDHDVATAVHVDILERLKDANIKSVDVRTAMSKISSDELPFFKTDFHWSPAGAREAARAIAAVIKADPIYEELEKTEYETVPAGIGTAFSGMRRILQARCLETLPEAETQTFVTTPVQDLDLGGGGLDLFGSDEEVLSVALLGTSFSDSTINNFPGFLAEFSSLEVVNYAMTGGGQFGAMTSYLTSDEFKETRPRFLIWENPIYTNLAQFGDQPMRELLAAAGDTCKVPLEGRMDETNTILSVNLADHNLGPDDTLFLDLNQKAGDKVHFKFKSHEGLERSKIIERGERLDRTGRFYMPLSGLWDAGAPSVDIFTDAPFSIHPSVFACKEMENEL